MSQNAASDTLYSPLTATDEIRLLEVQPGSAPTNICCTLRHAKLSDQPIYEALSYEWGSHQYLKTITVNNISVEVRENLWMALTHLRLESQPRLLWIDALCIHQNDTSERNHQVNQMGAIYSQARRVVAWLGPPDSSSRATFRLLAHAGPGSQWEAATQSQELIFDVTNIINVQAVDDFQEFCGRPYWSRIWIVQEILLAREIIIQSGDDWTNWSNLCTSFKFFDRTAISPDEYDQKLITLASSALAKLCREWKILRRGPLGLTHVLRTWVKLCRSYSSEGLCQDPKDKILALRSLAPGCCREALQADYSLTLAVLCTALLRHQILNHSKAPSFEAEQVLQIMGLRSRCHIESSMNKGRIIEQLEFMQREEALSLD